MPGALPLCIGMPVALTEHLDRSADKCLLKGSRGRVNSWVWPENDRTPSVVYVKFDNATWRLNGINEDGVYPIYPVSRTWHLEKNRKPSQLAVTRRQLPLIPGFAMTAPCSPGKTLAAALLDLNVDTRVDKSFGVVAASRVKRREDLFILRPFPRFLFQRGASEGPQLLLQKLRGESLDWDALHEDRAPFAQCSACQQIRTYDFFEHSQWELIRANLQAKCSVCTEDAKGVKRGSRRRTWAGGRRQQFDCHACKRRKIEDAFPRAQLADLDDDANEARGRNNVFAVYSPVCVCVGWGQSLKISRFFALAGPSASQATMLEVPTTSRNVIVQQVQFCERRGRL